MNNCSQDRNRNEIMCINISLHYNSSFHHLKTCKDDGSHGHVAMEIDGGVKRDVSVEESLSAQRDEVSTHGEEHVGKQEGDGGRRATGDSDAHN